SGTLAITVNGCAHSIKINVRKPRCKNTTGYCSPKRNNDGQDIEEESKSHNNSVLACSCDNTKDSRNCSYLDMIRTIMIVLAITFAIEAITSFIGSILGCMGTCCVPAEPVVIITGGVPIHGGSTVVVQSSQSSMHGYPALPSYAPSYAPPYADCNPLVKNMAI
ncbi:hypothetical protein, partial [Salmonella sp. s51933]|uniref:hypothetical protein n=1 Tax=Salmonella sp. s51933 TaxID=3160127 RepID=UPI0037551265